jgi:hypothetical protein
MSGSVEEWKDIPEYEGRYQASTLGRIRRINHPFRRNPTFVLRPQHRGEHGYLGVGLYHPLTGKHKSHFVHLLILAAFVGPRPPGMQGNHINHDKRDNALANLEYMTPSDNTIYALLNGMKKKTGKGRCLAPDEVRQILAFGPHVPTRKIANDFGVTFETIRCIRLGKRWRFLNPSAA